MSIEVFYFSIFTFGLLKKNPIPKKKNTNVPANVQDNFTPKPSKRIVSSLIPKKSSIIAMMNPIIQIMFFCLTADDSILMPSLFITAPCPFDTKSCFFFFFL